MRNRCSYPSKHFVFSMYLVSFYMILQILFEKSEQEKKNLTYFILSLSLYINNNINFHSRERKKWEET